MCARPVIGIPADRRIIEPHPFHVVGEKYIEAVASGAGGLPLLVPVLEPHVPPADVLDVIDGLFLTGSPSNVEPHRYRGEPSRPGTHHDPHRDEVTLPLITAALERGMPLFAVCRGFQEVNVALGGTLHQHVHEMPGYRVHRENHEDPIDVQYGPAHPVHLVSGGFLHELAGTDTVTVNSLHSQGIDRLAGGVTIEARADDGLVEGFSVDDAKRFAVAVQWHPEWRVWENPFSLALFEAFGEACRDYGAPDRDNDKKGARRPAATRVRS